MVSQSKRAICLFSVFILVGAISLRSYIYAAAMGGVPRPQATQTSLWTEGQVKISSAPAQSPPFDANQEALFKILKSKKRSRKILLKIVARAAVFDGVNTKEIFSRFIEKNPIDRALAPPTPPPC